MKNILFLILISVGIISCKVDEDPDIDNPNVESKQIDSTLKSFYPKPSPSSTFEQIYTYNFSVVSCAFDIDLYWYDPTSSHGIYLHFDNSIGDALIDANGFIKSFDTGVKIAFPFFSFFISISFFPRSR